MTSTHAPVLTATMQMIGDIDELMRPHREAVRAITAAYEPSRRHAEMTAEIARMFAPQKSAFDIIKASGMEALLGKTREVAKAGEAVRYVLEQSAAAKVPHADLMAYVAQVGRTGMLFDDKMASVAQLQKMVASAAAPPVAQPKRRPLVHAEDLEPAVSTSETQPQDARPPVVTYGELAWMLILVYQFAAVILAESSRERIEVSATTAVAVAVWILAKGMRR